MTPPMVLLRQFLRKLQPPLRQPDGPQEQLPEGLLAVWSLMSPAGLAAMTGMFRPSLARSAIPYSQQGYIGISTN